MNTNPFTREPRNTSNNRTVRYLWFLVGEMYGRTDSHYVTGGWEYPGAYRIQVRRRNLDDTFGAVLLSFILPPKGITP